MREPPRQEILYPLTEALDMKWFQDGVGDPPTIVHTIEVNFQHRTITLPEGKFDLDNFLYVVRDIMRLRLP